MPEVRFGSSGLFLSLFLALTGFFAFLVSQADFDPARSHRALHSLEARFGPLAGAASRGALGSFRGGEAEQVSRRRRDRVFGPPLSAAEAGGGMVGRIEFTTDRLLDSRGRLRRPRLLLFGRIARAIRPGSPYRAEILAPPPSGGDYRITAERLHGLKMWLVERGADPERILVGLKGEGRRLWRIVVRQRGNRGGTGEER